MVAVLVALVLLFAGVAALLREFIRATVRRQVSLAYFRYHQARPTVICAWPASSVIGQVGQLCGCTQTLPTMRLYLSRFFHSTRTSFPKTISERFSFERFPNGWPSSGASMPPAGSCAACARHRAPSRCRRRSRQRHAPRGWPQQHPDR